MELDIYRQRISTRWEDTAILWMLGAGRIGKPAELPLRFNPVSHFPSLHERNH